MKRSVAPLLLLIVLTVQYVSGYNLIEHDFMEHRTGMLSKSFSAWRDIDQELCQLQMEASPSLMNTMADATGKLQSGLLIGNVNSFGQYHQCLSVDQTVNDIHVKGKYCMASISFILNTIESEPEISLSSGTRSENPGLSMSGLLGICIPSACSSADVYGEDGTELLGINITLQELFCREKNDKPFAAHDIVAVIVFSILGLMMALSTSYHLYNLIYRDKDVPKILKSFSIHHNMCKLLKIPKGPNPINCINGIRTLSTVWVILLHAYQTSVTSVPTENPFDVIAWLGQFRSTWVLAATLSVDTFLYMTAFLLTWSVLKKFKRAGDFVKSVPMLYLNRYLRLTPLLAAVILLQVSLLNHVTDGPDWRLVDDSVEHCLNNWWVNFLYVQNYVRVDSGMCLAHSWYLAADMQMYVVSPLVLVFLFGGLKRAFTALSLALCAALGAVIGISFYYEFTRISEGLTVYYHSSLARATPFVFGIMIAYVMFLLKQRNSKITSKPYMLMHWIISAGLLIAPFVGTYTVYNTETSETTLNLFLGWHRSAWSLGIGGMIFACAQGFGGPVNWFLSLDLWTVPARLSYAIYLLHYPIMFTLAGSRLSPVYYTNLEVIKKYFGELVITFIASVILTLLVESPFAELSNLLMAKLSVKKRETKPKDVEETRNGAEVTKDQIQKQEEFHKVSSEIVNETRNVNLGAS